MQTLIPGDAPLSAWRGIYFGAGVALDPAARGAVATSAAAVEPIVAHGAPVYGINTGFGKLASVASPTRTSPPSNATSC